MFTIFANKHVHALNILLLILLLLHDSLHLCFQSVFNGPSVVFIVIFKFEPWVQGRGHVTVCVTEIICYLQFDALARSVSSSCTSNIWLLKRWRVGFRKETHFSPERASLNSTRGLSDLLMASSTSVSCHVREKTWAMAFCCSRTLSTIACLDPHLVGHSVFSECSAASEPLSEPPSLSNGRKSSHQSWDPL